MGGLSQGTAMRPELKPLAQQVLVITGASSGIGLVTTRAAARQGAKLVLVARNEAALQALTDELRLQHCDAIHVAADVGVQADIDRVVTQAISHFGGFDTWVNNAGVSIYGALEQASMEENRRLFDTNFWGIVHGALAARRHLRQRGGAIVTVGSMLSDMSLPMQGMYCASKHAVKGFLNALRMESEREGEPVSFTLIKPASVNSMLIENARNYLPMKPDLPPPVFAPRVVAEAILHAAQYPVRDIFVGEPAVAGSSFAQFAPGITDLVLRRFAVELQQQNVPDQRPSKGNLFAPNKIASLRESSDRKGVTFQHSPYTEAMTHWTNPLDLLRRAMGGR
jgi:short-subunit dehydrogenase